MSISDEQRFRDFQELVVYVFGSPRLYEALRELDSRDDTGFEEANNSPHTFLESYGILLSSTVKVAFYRNSPACIRINAWGYRAEFCL